MPSTVRQERPSLPVEEQPVVVAPAKPRLETQIVPAMIPLREDRSSAPLSFAQERYWFLEQINPGDVSLNICRAFMVKGELRQDLLERSLTQVISRHESLRTTFAINQLHAVRDSKPAPLVSTNSKFGISLIDLSSDDQNAENVARAAVQQPFDLTLGPLLRVTLIKLAPREHVLLLCAHRIVCDEASLQILFAELSPAYSEKQLAPPALPIQYADYAAWQRNSIASTDLEFWRTKLHGAPAVIELPTDRPRPAVRTWHGQSTRLRLENDLVDHLRRIAAEAGSSLDLLMLAALKVVLSRHSRQPDIVVGQAISNRDHAETRDLIGPISNHLPIRSSLAGEPTFLEFLSHVQHNALEAQAHSVPFEKVLEELQLQPGLSHTPVFQVSFQWQTNSGLEEFEFDDGVSRFDLMVEFTERRTHLDCRFRFSTDLFDDDTIARLATHLKILLEGMVSNPNQKISVLPLLAPSELRQIVNEWNRTETVIEDRCVHELFEQQVERTPTAVAVEFEETKLTYRELNERANQLAHYLRSAGAGADVLVGVCLERSAELVVALLGILKAGAAYLPIETEYPAERLRFMLNDSACPILITQKSLRDRIPTGARIVCLDEEEIAGQSRENPRFSVNPDNLVYAIYTSGSTGKPKGALITHRGLSNYLSWAIQAYPVAEGKGAPVHSSIAFDLTVTGLFTPLLVGRTAYLCVTSAFSAPPRLNVTAEPQRTQRSRRDVESLSAALKNGSGFSLIKITPAHLELLSHELTREEAARCASAFIIGGENLTADSIKFWQEAAPNTTLVNEYGPTETVVGCCVYTVGKEDKRGSIPIGRPIANTRLYTLSPQLQPQPVGVPGELYIGGAGLARGYLGRPDLTAERFVPDPFGSDAGARLYKTGDKAVYLEDGNIEFLGRLDHQVKIRGYRIEPEEIESVLQVHPLIRDCVVVVRDEADKRLVAYLVPQLDTNKPELLDENWNTEHVSQWRQFYEDMYSAEVADPTFNLAGWNSSYTGEAIPVEEMRQWVEHTVERILSLKPRRVFEIGCGSGLLLFRIAPHCDQYLGTDFSAAAIERLSKTLKNDSHVQLAHRTADDFEGIDAGSFDAVILNSVAQYFPGVSYFLDVVRGAIRAVKPGGAVFLGDLRSLDLLSVFHSSVQLSEADDKVKVTELRERIRNAVLKEEELVLDPELFIALQERMPEIASVQIQLKRGRYQNELSKFRYDVVIKTKDGSTSSLFPEQKSDWEKQGFTLADLRQYLLENQFQSLLLTQVPNARLRADLIIQTALSELEAETVGELRESLGELKDGVEPEDVWDLAAELGYDAEISWARSGAADRFDVLFKKAGEAMSAAETKRSIVPKPWSHYANNPLQGRLARGLSVQLQPYLRERLPDYMIPSALVVMENFPLTSNGKVDRKALPAPDHLRPVLQNAFATPRTQTEQIVANVFSEVLGIDRVGTNDNFFELGGHSLLATQVVSRLRKAFDMELVVRWIFEAPTVAELAARIDKTTGASDRSNIIPVTAAQRNRLPLSFAQQRLWFLTQLQPESPFYNVPLAFRLSGRLDDAALAHALETIVTRHETLRTVFDEVDDEPVQRVLPTQPLSLTAIDLTHVAGDRMEEARKLLRAEAERHFDFKQGPLFRTTLIRVDESEHILLLCAHHIVSDGWSAAILLRELGVLYDAYTHQQPASLPDLKIQYADYAVWQRNWLDEERLATHASFWKRHLAGAPLVLELPLDKPRPAVQTFNGADIVLKLSSDLTSSLKALGQQAGVTPFMTLMAAFQLFLARYSGREDIVVGADLANRNQVELEALIGFFVNLLPVRIDLSGNPTFNELLARARSTMLDVYAHQEFPFEKLVEELRPERDLRRNPVVQVLFVMQNSMQHELQFDGLDIEAFKFRDASSRFDLALFMSEAEREFTALWRYNPDLFEATTIAKMANEFQSLLKDIVADPSARLNKVKTMDQSERKESQIKRLRATRRKGVDLAEVASVKTGFLEEGQTLPLLIEPARVDVDLAEWALNNRQMLEQHLLRHGAILFRGFAVPAVNEFERTAEAICVELFGEYGDLPREELGGRVYGSTPYPADETILFHNESSHMHRWPMLIWFYCVKAALQGGESPIVDCRQMYQSMEPAIRERFEQAGLMYVRNFTDGLDVSWQEFFHTSDKSKVEQYCRAASIDFEWKAGGGLRTRQLCPAVVRHPQTDELVFFNQVQLHHISCLAPAVRESLLSMMKEEDLPRNVYYGDGSPIDDSVIDYLRELSQKLSVSFPWQEQDILMLNNMLVAHSRNPFLGERKIVVAMGDLVNKEQVGQVNNAEGVG